MGAEQRHRGAHPEDAADFAERREATLRSATEELSYLLTHDYAESAASKLVGDHHQLSARQRRAVGRAACSERDRVRRRALRRHLDQLAGETIALDGFNCLITLEAMFSGAPVFVGRDGATRDLASVHGSYKRVQETGRALDAMAQLLAQNGISRVLVRLDRPVCNSGKLRGLYEAAFLRCDLQTEVALGENVDRELLALSLPIASSDGFLLARAPWLDLPAAIAEAHALPLWRLQLGEPVTA